MAKRKRRKELPLAEFPDPYMELWLSLTPAERLRRSWKLRSRLRNIQAIHDAKTYPEL